MRKKAIFIEFTDFNAASTVITNHYSAEWNDFNSVISTMPLHLKASGQARIEQNPVFDPVGTNQYIKAALVKLGWQSNIPIPRQYRFLGTAIDFGKSGMLVEVQFSHYAFLPNNTLRAELFFKAKTPLTSQPTKVVVLLAKSQMFPASNSSLYYEQAVNWLTALAEKNVFDVPLRLVGLFELRNATLQSNVPCKFTVYKGATSRTIDTQEDRLCQITPGRLANSRFLLRLL